MSRFYSMHLIRARPRASS